MVERKAATAMGEEAGDSVADRIRLREAARWAAGPGCQGEGACRAEVGRPAVAVRCRVALEGGTLGRRNEQNVDAVAGNCEDAFVSGRVRTETRLVMHGRQAEKVPTIPFWNAGDFKISKFSCGSAGRDLGCTKGCDR